MVSLSHGIITRCRYHAAAAPGSNGKALPKSIPEMHAKFFITILWLTLLRKLLCQLALSQPQCLPAASRLAALLTILALKKTAIDSSNNEQVDSSND